MNERENVRQLYMVLDAVHNGRDIGTLNRRGLEAHQILSILQLAVSKQLVAIDDKNAALTKSGRLYFETIRAEFHFGGPNDWIRPDQRATGELIGPLDVYLPKRGWGD